ncbi:MAG TPA: Ig-like domain-containing protein, partial [Gemmatimonadaceae bacterium]
GSTTLTAVTKDASGNVLAGRTVTWTSSAPSIASVSSAGVVTGVAAGNATITATSEGKSTDTPVSVALAPVATITLTPTSASLVVGNATTITAVLKDAGGNVLTGRTIAWSSSVPGAATVDVNGVVTAVSAGTATITATSEGKTATATITVSLIPVASVTTNPTSANLLVGGTLAMSAITKDANGNVLAGRIVVWSTSAPSVATVNPNTGLVTAVGAGNATITATSEGKTGGASIVVALVPVATVTVNPSTATIIDGQTTTLAAITKDANGNTLTGRTIVWTTSKAAVATVASGLVSAVDTGTATITATAEGKSGIATITVIPVPVASVTVRPLTISLPQGATTKFVATLEDSNNQPLRGRVVSWTSSAPSLAAVSATSVDSNFVTAIRGGSATITATSEGKTGTATVIVTDTVAAVVVTPSPVSLPRYKTVTLSATTNADDGTPLGRAVTWSSNATSVATVDASGVVTAVDVGSATITATSEGKQGAANITITQAAVDTVRINGPIPSLTVNGTTTVTATTTDQKGITLSGRTVTWSSDNTAVATVDPSTGLVTAVAAGTANIIATSETKTGSAAVTVTDPVTSVTVSPTAPSVTVGQTQQMTATTTDINGQPLSGRSVTWASDNSAVASVDPSTGVVTAVAAGTANITATSEGVTSSPAVVTVTNVAVATVEVTPANPSISAGISETVTLTATPRDGGGNALSMSGRTLTWASDTPSVATVDPSTEV